MECIASAKGKLMVLVLDLRPIQIYVEGIGPFAPGHSTGALLLGPHPPRHEGDEVVEGNVQDRFRRHQAWQPPDEYHRKRSLPDIVVLHAGEGPGASALLTCIHDLFGSLLGAPTGLFAPNAAESRPAPRGRAQLDLRATCIADGSIRNIILSLWYGRDEPPVDWNDLLGREDAWGANEWAHIGFLHDGSLAGGTNALGLGILAAVQASKGTKLPLPRIAGTHSIPAFHGLSALPSALLFKHKRTRTARGYDPAPILDLQFCTDLAQGAAGSAEEIHRIRTHLSGYAFDQREFPESRTNWKGSGLELVDCLTREEYAELGWRLGAMLQGTRASLILVEDVDADLGSKGICRLPYWFRKTSLDHPGSALMISVREPHTAEAIAKASKAYDLVTTVISMVAVHRR
jgi:hypothetical protein